MAKKKIAPKTARTKKTRSAAKLAKSPKPRTQAALKKPKSLKREKTARQNRRQSPRLLAGADEKARVLASETVFEGPLFRVLRDRLIEPGGKEGVRDVVRHNGSVVILALDKSRSKKDPYIVMERQYRHAANRFLWELPAGKLDRGESPLDGARRELEEETGYRARKWKPLVEYYASPGFLGESMQIFLADGLIAGDAHPEEDEQIEIRLVRLSEILDAIDQGVILDGKTLTGVLLFARQKTLKKRKH